MPRGGTYNGPYQMERDTKRPLNDIYETTGNLIVDLCNIQYFTTDRAEAVEWAQNLRLLKTPTVPAEALSRKRKRGAVEVRASAKVRRLLQTVSESEAGLNVKYLAVSHSWRHEHDGDDEQRYHVKDEDHVRESQVSVDVLDRVIKYAQVKNIPYIWIDRECNKDRDTDRQTIAVQAMDLVYRRATHIVGPLEKTIDTQTEINALTLLVQGALVSNDGALNDVGQRVLGHTIKALDKISSDKFWTRVWIFQEEYCASSHLDLLVRYNPGLRNGGVLRGIPGELRLRASRLRQEATRFLLACSNQHIDVPSRVLTRFKQYNIINKISNGPDSSQLRFRSSTHNVLQDIDARDSRYVHDRLAIIANCLKYSRRLNGVKLRNNGYGLSASILTLCLMNGEIFYSRSPSLDPNDDEQSQDRRGPFSQTALEYLSRVLFADFSPPGQAYHLWTISSYRLTNVELTPMGVRSSGWLWELGDPLDNPCTATDTESSSENEANTQTTSRPNDAKSKKSSNAEDKLLALLVTNGHEALASRIAAYIAKEKRTDTLRARYMDSQLSAILAALGTSSESVSEPSLSHLLHLRPAHLLGDKRASKRCCALFLASEDEKVVFTSSPDIERDATGSDYDVYTVASLGVEIERRQRRKGEEDRTCALRWVNGLWFVGGVRRRGVVFPYWF